MKDSSTPSAGYLAHDFARFRKDRLETQRLERARAELEASRDEDDPERSEDSGMFFGTSSIERRRLRASNRTERGGREVSKAEGKTPPPRRRRRHPAPPFPTRGPRTTPPHGVRIRKRGRPRRAG